MLTKKIRYLDTSQQNIVCVESLSLVIKRGRHEETFRRNLVELNSACKKFQMEILSRCVFLDPYLENYRMYFQLICFLLWHVNEVNMTIIWAIMSEFSTCAACKGTPFKRWGRPTSHYSCQCRPYDWQVGDNWKTRFGLKAPDTSLPQSPCTVEGAGWQVRRGGVTFPQGG